MTASIDHTRQLAAVHSAAEGREGQKSGAPRERTGGGVKKIRAQVPETFFGTEQLLADPNYVVGARRIGKAINLGRCATMRVIHKGLLRTIIVADMRCAERSEIDRYLAEQNTTDAWATEGGSPGPERVEQPWTEASWRRRRRGRERP